MRRISIPILIAIATPLFLFALLLLAAADQLDADVMGDRRTFHFD